MPYSHGVQLLNGVNVTGYELKGNAFRLDGGGIKAEPDTVSSDTIQRSIITSTSEYAQNLKAFADFSFNGWMAYV